VARRLLALALILDGRKREDAARLAGVEPRGLPDMNRQALRDWVHRCNADGVTGLADRHGGGVARRLSAEQEAEVIAKPDNQARPASSTPTLLQREG